MTTKSTRLPTAPAHKLDETRPFIPVRFAVLTMSDTRTIEEDRSGATLADRITKAGHELVDRAIVRDDADDIKKTVLEWSKNEGIDAIITTGGTGFTGRDVTPEALESLFDKRMDGFSVLFQAVSLASIGTSAIQSRATAGLINATYVFCLPGSTGACKDAWDEILVWQFDYRHKPCNFVEIMPRLDEHLQSRGKAVL